MTPPADPRDVFAAVVDLVAIALALSVFAVWLSRKT
jgi:hypothetical protein